MTVYMKTVCLVMGIAFGIAQSALPARADAEEPPQGIYAYAGSAQLIVLQWGSPANVPDVFRIYRSGWAQPKDVPATASSYYDNGLSANTPYTYHVCSVYGGSEYCTQDVTAYTASASNGGSDVPPPTLGTITALSDTITVHWDAGKDYGYYNVRFGPKGGWENQTEIDSSGNNGWYRWTQLTAGSTYTFKVQGCFSGILQSHCSPWTVANIATIMPPPPPPHAARTEIVSAAATPRAARVRMGAPVKATNTCSIVAVAALLGQGTCDRRDGAVRAAESPTSVRVLSDYGDKGVALSRRLITATPPPRK